MGGRWKSPTTTTVHPPDSSVTPVAGPSWPCPLSPCPCPDLPYRVQVSPRIMTSVHLYMDSGYCGSVAGPDYLDHQKKHPRQAGRRQRFWRTTSKYARPLRFRSKYPGSSQLRRKQRDETVAARKEAPSLIHRFTPTRGGHRSPSRGDVCVLPARIRRKRTGQQERERERHRPSRARAWPPFSPLGWRLWEDGVWTSHSGVSLGDR